MAPLLPDQPYKKQPRVDEYLQIAEKVRTGEYYREARQMYDFTVHDPMAERYLYIFITVSALLILLISLSAMQALYPLRRDVPFIYSTNDIVEDIPRIQRLIARDTEEDVSPGNALLLLLVRNYVTMRESYNIAFFDRNVNGVKSQSSEEVYKEFQQFVDPRNPDSPLAVYQRHSKRNIRVLNTRVLEDGVEVIFEATVESRSDIKRSHWRVDISYKYSGIELDEKTGKVKPVIFVVTKYRSKRLQDSK